MHAAGAQKISLRGEYSSLCALTSKITPLVGSAERSTATFGARIAFRSLLLPVRESRTIPRMAAEETMSIQRAERTDEKLVRGIGIPALTANIISSTIGAGIFVIPATVAIGLGPAAPLAFVCCAIAMVLFVTCFAIAGSRVSLTGGLYAYVEVAFGRYVGFLAGVLYFLTAILAISGVVGLIAISVGQLIPGLATPTGRLFVILFVFLFLAAINIRGVRIGTRAVEAVTLI